MALQDARAARTRATAAVQHHDTDCASCDVRRRRRCPTGRILVEACWEAEAAVDEARRAGTPRTTRQPALFSASRVR
jgi:hypothetical protein